MVELDARRGLAASRRAGQLARRDAKTIPSSTSAGTTPPPMPIGPANDCPPRPNGNSPLAAAWTPSPTSGATTPVRRQHPQANIWQGRLPRHQHQDSDSFIRTAPVKSFPPNGFGLYDMAGNVWEWCTDWYRAGPLSEQLTATGGKSSSIPTAPTRVSTQPNPTPRTASSAAARSCATTATALSYRPSGRRGLTPDTGMSHVGFRCAQTP